MLRARHTSMADSDASGWCGSITALWPRSQLAPHATQLRSDIDADWRLQFRGITDGCRHRCDRPSEQGHDVIGQEARARCDDVAIAETMLLRSKEPERLHQVEMFPRAGHRDVE